MQNPHTKSKPSVTCLHNNFILLENELGTFALVKVASMQWGTLVKNVKVTTLMFLCLVI